MPHFDTILISWKIRCMRNDLNNDWQAEEGGKSQDLRIENEILKMKMEAEFGANVHSAGANFPPELENRFLKSIYDFELASRKNVSKLTLFEIIGCPEVRCSSELNEVEVEQELKRIIQIMLDHQIVLNTRKSYQSHIIYDFIISELFPYEMENLQIPGYYCHFAYEDFHPDHDYDLRVDAKEFLQLVISQTLDREYNGMYDQVVLEDGRILTSKETYDRIMWSLSDYSECRLKELEIQEVSFTETDALVRFQIEYSCCYLAKENITIRGSGKLAYRKDYGGYWYVSELIIPGIVL